MPDGGSAPRPRTASGGLTVDGAVSRPRAGRKHLFAHALRGLAAALLLAAAGLLAMPHQAQAQTAYVSNSDVWGTNSSYGASSTAWHAMEFTTGSQAGGYELGSIGLAFTATKTSTTSLVVRLYTESGGLPDSLVDTLENPGSLTGGEEALFTPSTSVTLAADTSYIVAVEPSGATWNWMLATSGAEDSGASAGWSIGTRLFRGGASDDWATRTNWMSLSVYPPSTNTAPTASNNTVTTNEDTNHVFAATEFNFADDDAGDTLASVKITTLEAAGRLKLGDDDVALNAVVTKTQIDEGKLKFVPDADANGSSYATFGFTVNDGEDDSASAYTMTIDVTAVNDPPTAEEVDLTIDEDTPHTFTATDFNFMDVDGDTLASVRIRDFTPANCLFHDGTVVANNQVITRADIDGGKLQAIPPANENGIELCYFSFWVSDGTVESSPFSTALITVTAVNDAPTAADNTVTTDQDTAYTFTAADFGFMDVDGDALASVKITTLPANGVLSADGTLVELNDAISKTDIDASKLVFTPASGESGAPYDTFGFTVNDGTVDSASAYTMKIDVTAALPAASVLISNLGQTGIGSTGLAEDGNYAQGFSTDRDFAVLDSVDVRFSSINLEAADWSHSTAEVWRASDEDDTLPGTLVATLANPTDRSNSATATTRRFTAPADTVLKPATNYFLVFTFGFADSDSLSQVAIAFVGTGDDAGGADGWEIFDRYVDRTSGGEWLSSRNKALAISVNGTVQQRVCDAEALWCETLIVGSASNTGKGYCKDAGTPCNGAGKYYGRITGDEFELVPGGTTYTVESVRWAIASGGDGGSGPRLHLTLDRDLPAGDLARLTLKVGAHEFALADAGRNNSSSDINNNYRWQNPPSQLRNAGAESTWTVQLVRTAATDATLSDLEVENADDGTAIALRPAFDAATTSYAVSVPYGTETVTVTPTVNDAGADFAVLDENGDAIPDADTTDGEDDHDVALSVGANEINVRVTAEDGDATETYTVTVTRAASRVLSSRTLVDNSSTDSGTITSTASVAQRFSTGASAAGYTLEEVAIDYLDPQGDAFTLKVCTVTGADQPTADCTEFSAPATFSSGTPAAFTHSAGMHLMPGTKYAVVLTPDAGKTINHAVTTFDSENAGGLSDWNIAGEFREESGGTWNANANSRALRMHLKGYVNADSNTAPTAADNTVTTAQDTAYTFTATDFGFMDSDAGDELAAVTITSVEDEGDLELDGSDVMPGEIVAKADIDGGKLTFTPDSGESGSRYTRFRFTVNDGDDDSASSYTMTIDVTAAACHDEVRLSGGGSVSEGDVEYCRNGEWRAVCDDRWNKDAAHVACRQAGYPRGAIEAKIESFFDNLGSAGYWLDEVVCTGNESSLAECRHNNWGDHDCTPGVAGEVAGVVCRADAAPTGAPAVTGTAKAGQTLTAGTSGIADADGLATPGWSYQWIRVAAGGMETNVGADQDTYTLVADDVGATIKVAVSFTDDGGNAEGPLESVETSAVVAASDTNAAPTASDRTVTTDRDTAYAFTADDFGFSDGDAADTLAGVRITTLETAGDLLLDGADVATGRFVTRAEIDAGELTFTPAPGRFGSGYASFGFKVNDGTSDSASAYTMTVDVTGDDLPLITEMSVGASGNKRGYSDLNLAIFGSLDDDTFVRGTHEHTVRILDADSGTVTIRFHPSPGTSSGLVLEWAGETLPLDSATNTFISGGSLQLSFNDTWLTANAPGLSNASYKTTLASGDTVSVCIRTASQACLPMASGDNAAPTAANNTVTTKEDTAYAFKASDFGFSDTDEGDELAAVTVTSLESTGDLELAGVDVTAGQAIARAHIDAGRLTFTPDPGETGTGYATFGFKVSDGLADSASAYVMTVDVAMNSRPTSSDRTVTTAENTDYTFTVADFDFMDDDAVDTLASVRITAVETYGDLELDGSDVYNGQAITHADIGAGRLKFAPASSASGTDYATFEFKVSDGTHESVSAYTMTIDVTAVSDTPADALVSNLDQGGDSERLNILQDFAQQFTTGSNSAGYTLTGVDIKVEADNDGASFSMSVCTVDTDGYPASSCTALTAPSDFTARHLSFTAPADTTLAASTKYAVVLDFGAISDLDATTSDGEDAGGAAGWSLADAHFFKSGGTWATTTQGLSLRIAVRGALNTNNAPTASDNTVTTAEDTAYTFTAEDFGFEDLDGDDLASVKITALEDEGDLEFDDADVTEDQVIAKSDIEAGKLVFTPASGESGDDYTTFDFTVNDGTDDSASEYTMTIDVTAAEANATGAPAIAGVPQAGMVLTAGIGTIADEDGRPDDFPDDYTFQWVRTLSGTESDISGATSATYTLTGEDVGATIRVEVSFDDDDDNAEGPLASADTAAVVAAADDCATDRAGADWCTTLTVGSQIAGPWVQYGFNGVGLSTYGALENDTIDNDGTDFTVEYLLLTVSTGNPALSEVQVALDAFLQRRTVFDLGGTVTFTTDFASETSNLGRYEWPLPSGMSWIEGQEVTVSAVLGDNFAPTASDGTIVTATDTPFELAVADFGYEDADDDPLSSVRITSVATDGVLALNGTAVVQNQQIGRSDIDAGNLVFTPGSGEMGDPYATFGFRVSDGTDESGGAPYTMTVDVTDSACEGQVRLIGGGSVDSRGDVEVCRSNEWRWVCDDGWGKVDADVACRQAGYPRGAIHARIGSYYVNFVNVDFWLDDVDCDGTESSLAECSHAGWGTISSNCDYHERAGADCRADALPAGAPAITGTAKVGETLTAGTSGITDADGLTTPGWSYRWIRIAADRTETDVGTDQATYTLVADDIGSTIRVEVTFTDDGGNAEGPLASPETALVASLNAVPTGKPEISGPPQVGKTLTAGLGDVADGDDLPSTVFPAGYTFQWFEVDGATETDIAGATSRTYTPMAANVAKAIRVRVGYTDGGGTAETVESEATYAVMPAAASNCGADTVWCATLTVGQLDSNSDGAPEAVGYGGSGGYGTRAPAGFTIGGTQYTVTKLAVDGQRDVKFSTDPDLPASGAGLTLRLQNVSGERALRLNAAGADPGADWLFASGAHTDSGEPASAVSVLRNLAASDPLPADTDIGTEVAVRLDLVPNVPATGRPTVAGVAAVRQTLTAGFSGIMDANGLPDGAGGFACTWFRVADGTEIAIPGADSCLYRVEAADEGAKVKVKVSFTDRLGYAEGPIASAAWPAGSGAIGPAPVGEEGELRLTGGLSENEGILEVFHAGQWGTVCDDRFTSPGNRAPEFACELMGYAGGSYAGSRGETALTEADQPIWLDDVRCFEGSTHWTGSPPEALSHCWHAGWGLNNCDHAQDVKLQCAGTSMHQSLEPLTAAFLHVPVSHGGSGSSFTLRVSFSAEVEISPEDLRDHALSATGGTIAGVTRVGGAKDLFEVTVEPDGDDAVSVALAPPPGDCAVEGAVCTAEGVALTVLALTQVRGPGPGLTVADAEATEGTDTSLDFVVTLSPASTGTVTVAYATSDGTATAPADYASKNGTLTFDPGETSMTVSVDIEDDTVEDSGETMTLTLSGATGAAIDDAEAVGTIYNTEPLTASFSSVAREHDGSGVFLVELDFSEDVEGLSYRTLKFGGIEVTGGTVRRAKRRPPGSGQGKYWTIHVKPDTDGDVTVVLPETVDCAAAGAVCTLDGRMLSNGSRATVPGPGSVPLVSVEAVASPVPEGTAASFTLRRRGGPATALTVAVEVAEDGSMVDGEAPVSATFAAGSATAALTVATADDEVAEVASAVTATVPAGTGQAPEPGAESASVTVADDDAAPVVVTATPVPAAENGTAVAVLAATDADTAVEALAWSLVGGADREMFTLDAAGVLAFGAAKDFEAPDDADADGGYEVVVRVTDGANAVDTALTVRLTDAADAAPTGLPEISGAARVGEVLTASAAGIEDADGLTEPGFAWQWIANDGNEDADIEGATSDSWTLTAAEQGKTIRVRVTFTDDGGAEEVLESAATAAVGAALPQVSIRADASPVTEGAAAAFTLTRTGAAAEALTVAVSVGEAGAVLSATPPAAATFAAGDAETALSVATENDARDEADARVTAAVAAGTGYAVDPEAGSAGVDVYDDDAAAPGEPVVTTLWSTELEWTDMNGEWLVANADDFADAGWSEDGSAFTVWYFAYGPFDGDLWLRLNSSLSGADIPRAGELTLEIGEETVAAGDALSAFASGGIGIAGEVWRDWAVGDRVPVRLVRTETASASLPGLTVEDAQVREADGLPLSFTVTLGEAQASAVSVRYATSDGTAVAPADYGARSGMLRFEPGETVKTVLVPVIADDHNEGSETMALALSQPFGAAIADAAATGTIVNTGPIPRAWLARFGRTVADQVLAAVEERLRAPRAPRSEIGLAGQRLGLGALFGGEAGKGAGKADGGGMAGADNADAGADEGAAGGSRPGWTVAADAEETARLEALTAWLKGEDPGSGAGPEEEAQRTRAMTGRDLLMGSSFSLAGETRDGGFAALWGRMAQSRFAGREGALGVDGEVTTGLLGLDRAWDRWTAGLVVSRSAGKGGYGGQRAGDIEATVTAVTPWAGYAASERVSVWGAAGYGEGELTVKPDEQAAMRTDLSMKLAAAGARGRLAGKRDGPRLDAAAGARWVRTSSARLSSSSGNLAAASADVWRLTLGLEGSWRLALGGERAGEGAEATPRLALGLRHDGGDAETGYGVDIAGGLDIALPAEGLTASLSGRGVLTHEAPGLSDRGIAGTLSWDPDPASGRGPSLSLGQTFGNGASSGKDALLARETLEGLAANDNSGAGGDEFDRRRLEARFGYGFGMFGDRFTGTPEVGLNAADTGREAVLGWRLEEERRRGLAFGLDVEAARRESAGGASGHRLDLGFGWRLEAAGGGGFEVRFEGSRLDPGERRAGVRLTARW